MAYHIKTRIAVSFALLTMIIILLISWAVHSYFENQFKESSFSHIKDNLKVTASGLSNKAHNALHSLEVIRNSIPPGTIADHKKMQQFLNSLDSELLIFDNGIIFFSPEGRLVAVNPKQKDVLGMDFSFRDYIKITLLNRQPYISAPIKSRQAHHHPIIVITEPVFDKQDNIVAILAGSFDLHSNNFLKNFVDNKVGENGYYMMLDQHETMIVHPDKSYILQPSSNILPREQIIQFLTNSHGLIPETMVNGQKMIGAFHHVSPLNWTLVALTPLAEVYQPIRQARFYTTLVMCVLLSYL